MKFKIGDIVQIIGIDTKSNDSGEHHKIGAIGRIVTTMGAIFPYYVAVGNLKYYHSETELALCNIKEEDTKLRLDLRTIIESEISNLNQRR